MTRHFSYYRTNAHRTDVPNHPACYAAQGQNHQLSFYSLLSRFITHLFDLLTSECLELCGCHCEVRRKGGKREESKFRGDKDEVSLICIRRKGQRDRRSGRLGHLHVFIGTHQVHVKSSSSSQAVHGVTQRGERPTVEGQGPSGSTSLQSNQRPAICTTKLFQLKYILYCSTVGVGTLCGDN